MVSILKGRFEHKVLVAFTLKLLNKFLDEAFESSNLNGVIIAFFFQSQGLLFVWLFRLFVFLKFFVLFTELIFDGFQLWRPFDQFVLSMLQQFFEHFKVKIVNDSFMLD
jgi:hypothetical protein